MVGARVSVLSPPVISHSEDDERTSSPLFLTAVASQSLCQVVLLNSSDRAVKQTNELLQLSIKKENPPTTIIRLNSN